MYWGVIADLCVHFGKNIILFIVILVFSDCMVLGHNLEENPQRMFAINFVYIGSASGIFGEKNLYE
jgi:hypothetical protein